MHQSGSTQKLFEAAIQQFDGGDLGQADQLCQQVLVAEPEHSAALCLQGIIARRMGQAPLAVEFISRALEKEPANPTYWQHLGLAMQDLGFRDEAIQLYRQGLAFDGKHLDLLTNLARALAEKGQTAEADACFQKAMEAVPNNPGLCMNYGNHLMAQGRADEAVVQYQRALQLDAAFWLAHFNLGSAAYQAQDYPQAIARFEACLKINPAYESAYFYLAYAHKMLGQAQDELAVYQRLAQRDPNSVLAVSRMGIWHEARHELQEAVSYFERVADLQPEQALWNVRLAGLFPSIVTSNEMIDADRERLMQALQKAAENPSRFDLKQAFDSRCQPPSVLAYQGRDDLKLKSQFADWMVSKLGIRVGKLQAAPLENRKIKIGFLVTENHERVFKRVLGGYLKHLNRERFELQIVCPQNRIAGLQSIFTELTDVHYVGLPLSIDQSVVALSQTNLDVLFFFEVGTDVKNYLLSLYRFAPVQCTSWGYPTTSGSPNMDYYISSALLEPEDGQAQYREKLLLMDSLPSYFSAPNLPTTFKTRAQLGLDEATHLYVCPQTLLKFHPDFDEILSRILAEDLQGVIVLPEGLYSVWTDALKARFQKTIPNAAERIRFLPQLPYEDYLSLLHHSDALLDPLHFGGGLTTYEMLALGAPVVTLPGNSMRGRFTLGCYRKMGILDCVAKSTDDYVALALKLANEPDYRKALQEKIRTGSKVLFEDMNVIRQMEQLLIQAVEEASATSHSC